MQYSYLNSYPGLGEEEGYARRGCRGVRTLDVVLGQRIITTKLATFAAVCGVNFGDNPGGHRRGGGPRGGHRPVRRGKKSVVSPTHRGFNRSYTREIFDSTTYF